MTSDLVVEPAPDDTVSTDGSILTSTNPANGDVLGHVQLVDRAGIDACLQNAHAAAGVWGRTSPRSRRVYLRQLRYTLLNESENLAHLIAMEQGKTPVEAYTTEIFPALALLKWLEKEGLGRLAPQRVAPSHPLFGGKRMYYRFDPLGVVALITPSNYPFGIPFTQLAMAVAAGDTVVIKPSPLTPLVGQKIGDLSRQAGLPEGVVSVLQVTDDDAPTLVTHPMVDKLLFTGSTETARTVMAAAAEHLTPLVVEAGSADPAIVARDANLNRAVPGIVWYAFVNCGQSCSAIEAVYVHRHLADDFIDRVVDRVRRLRVGDPRDTDVEIGPLTSAAQLSVVEEHVQDAVAQGATVLTGGQRLDRPGFFYAPTVLTDVDHSMRIMQEETFGPVLPIIVVDSLEEALKLANSGAGSLTASVWTTNPTRAHDLAARLEVGAVNVNDHACHWAEPRAAWGGVGESGFGRTLGPYGLLELVNVKFVTEEYRARNNDPWWYPYNRHLKPLLANVSRALYGPLTRRPWALVNLLLNPNTYSRAHVLDYVRHIRTWF